MSELKQMDLIRLMDNFHSDEKCRDILTGLAFGRCLYTVQLIPHPQYTQ